jgi:mannosyltransferase OCH1-like enzyme
MAIPKILHQIWNDRQVPRVFDEYVASWKANHPDWEYRLWTFEDNRRFVAEHYPWFLSTYDGYPKPIQRADAARYFILHKCGGVYVDLDFLSFSPITPLLSGRECVLGVEPPEHCRQFGVPKFVGNALMAAAPEHPFFKTVIRELSNFVDHVECDQPILSSTGPLMLTRVYERFADKNTMAVLPSRYFYPLTLHQATEYRLTGRTDVDLSESVAVHLYCGSWWKPSWWDLQRRIGFAVAGAARACTSLIHKLRSIDVPLTVRASKSRRGAKNEDVRPEGESRRAA